MRLKEARQRVADLKKRLRERYGPEDAYALLTDLAEEVGENAKAVKAREGVTGKDKEKE